MSRLYRTHDFLSGRMLNHTYGAYRSRNRRELLHEKFSILISGPGLSLMSIHSRPRRKLPGSFFYIKSKSAVSISVHRGFIGVLHRPTFLYIWM